MQGKNWAGNNYILCINCLNCKKKDEKIRCSRDYFSDIPYKKVILLTPDSFDCWEYEEVD